MKKRFSVATILILSLQTSLAFAESDSWMHADPHGLGPIPTRALRDGVLNIDEGDLAGQGVGDERIQVSPFQDHYAFATVFPSAQVDAEKETAERQKLIAAFQKIAAEEHGQAANACRSQGKVPSPTAMKFHRIAFVKDQDEINFERKLARTKVNSSTFADSVGTCIANAFRWLTSWNAPAKMSDGCFDSPIDSGIKDERFSLAQEPFHAVHSDNVPTEDVIFIKADEDSMRAALKRSLIGGDLTCQEAPIAAISDQNALKPTRLYPESHDPIRITPSHAGYGDCVDSNCGLAGEIY